MTGLAVAAAGYAACGWKVFPCRPRGKEPLTKDGGGYLGGTNDLQQVEAWWRRTPDANIGLACAPSGLVVLDVDGAPGLDSLRTHPGPVPLTTLSLTGRGGHLFYRIPEGAEPRPSGTAVDGWVGLDVRSNGYAILPPSIHPGTGRAYRWDVPPGRLAPQPAPAWLLRVPAPPRAALPPATVSLGGATGTAYGVAALRGLLEGLASTAPGSRHTRTYSTACRIGELILAGHLDAEDAPRRLRLAALAAFGDEDADAEVAVTVRDGLAKAGVR